MRTLLDDRVEEKEALQRRLFEVERAHTLRKQTDRQVTSELWDERRHRLEEAARVRKLQLS